MSHKLASAEKLAGHERGRRLAEDRRKQAYAARRVSLSLSLPTTTGNLTVALGDRGAA